MLRQRGWVKERILVILKSAFGRSPWPMLKIPADTLIVSPDNASRRQINDAVRRELQAQGVVSHENYSLRILVPRQELTGAESAR